MTKRLLVLPAAVLAVAVVAGCGGSSSPSASTTPSTSTSPSGNAPADPAAAKAAITANWQTFFDASTPPAQAVALLEDGDQLGAALQLAKQERAATKINQKAKVSGIVFTSATSATVTYDLLNGTTAVLPGATGTAVYVDGKWKVSKSTFCSLVTLGNNNKAPAGC